MKVTISNIGRAAAGVHGVAGLVWVAPGGSADVTMWPEQFERLQHRAEKLGLNIDGFEDDGLEGLDVFEPFAAASHHDDGLAASVDALTVRAETAENGLQAANDELAALKRSPALLGPVIRALSHEDAAHWTTVGLPAVDAVKNSAGVDVSRADIEAAAPDFNREAAKAAAEQNAQGEVTGA